jgi:SAM-dependent methyltransferase
VNWKSSDLPDPEGYAAVFEKRAAEYDYAMKFAPKARDAEFMALLEPLSGLSPGLVCDVPAGGGYLAPYLPRGFEYVGVEPTSEFLTDWPDGLRKVSSGMTDVPLAPESVDYIVSLAGLHHEPDLRPVFDEFRRMVRDSGRVIVSDAASGTAPALFLNGFVDENNPLGHDGRFLDDSTASLLEASGFAIRDDRLLDVPWSFASATEAGEFCRHLFGTSSLDANEVSRALDREIGFDWSEGRPSLRWKLRRIVCDPA